MRSLLRHESIWGFSKGKEQAYLEFIAPGNLGSLRLINWLALLGNGAFIVVDLGREVDHGFMLLGRGFAVVMAASFIIISHYRRFSGIQTEWMILFSVVNHFVVTLLLIHFARMPAFSLPNLTFLGLVLTLISGLRWIPFLSLSVFYLLSYVLYITFIHQDPYYFSQMPHLASSAFFLAIAGWALEGRRRAKFNQYTNLLYQKKMVETLNQQKNKIISVLSHDLLSPVNSLSGLLNIYRKGGVRGDELGPFLADVGGRLENVSSLLYNLVRWAKSQMDGFEPSKDRVFIDEILQENKELLEPVAAQKQVGVVFRRHDHESVTGDKDLIRLAVRNVISNAIKFARPHTNVRLDTAVEGANLILSVSNSGEGIMPDLAEQLFQYGIRPSVGTGGERGSGMGLAMAREFVRKCGGDVYLKDSSAESTTFCIALPVESPVRK